MALLAFLGAYTNATYPMIGIDYRLFLSRLIDTHLHYVVNGLEIQWYTPSFGAGLPAYPNPLQMQFSIPQLFTWFTDPWTAVILSSLLFVTIGFWLFFLFLHDTLGFTPLSSILGAIFFSANGFIIERLAIGHVNFITFPLIIIPLYALFSPRIPRWVAGVFISIFSAILVYSGGVYIGVIGVFSLLISVPLVYFIKPDVVSWRRILSVLALGAGLSLLLCGSKFFATLAYMENFPREVHDQYSVEWTTGLGGLVAQLSGAQLVLPFLKLINKSGLDFVVRLSNWTGTAYGFWELDSSLSPALLLVLLYGAGAVLLKRPKMNRKNVIGRIIAAIVIIIAIIATIQFSIARGFLFTELSKLPVLKSLHANTRFASAFILPLAILGAKIFNDWSNRKPSPGRIFPAFALINILALMALWGYFFLPMEVQQRNLDGSIFTETYQIIAGGDTLPVETIVPDMNDYEVFTLHASNTIRHYEPLFGNDSELFHPLVHAGSVFDQEDGYLNFTNPAGYVFQEVSGVKMYERFKVEDAAILEEFLQRRQPDMELPTIQIILDWAAGLTWILVLLSLGYLLVKKLGIPHKAR